MKYKEIRTATGTKIPTQTIASLKRLVRKGRVSDGNFRCTSKHAVHVWKITSNILQGKKKQYNRPRAEFLGQA